MVTAAVRMASSSGAVLLGKCYAPTSVHLLPPPANAGVPSRPALETQEQQKEVRRADSWAPAGALWLLACVTSTGSLSCSSLPPADAPDASLRRQDRCSGRRASIYRQGRDGAGIGFIPAQVFAEPRLQRAICRRSSEVGTPGTWRRRRCAASWCCSGNTKASVKAEEQSLAAAQSPPSPADDATAVPKAVLEPIEWEDSWLDRALHRILKERVDAAIGKRSGNSGPKLGAGRGAHATAAKARLLPLGGHQGGHDEYDAFIRAALQLSRMPAADTRARTLALLYELFPPWFVPSFRTFLSWWPMWFDARHAAASSVLLTGWLVGPSRCAQPTAL